MDRKKRNPAAVEAGGVPEVDQLGGEVNQDITLDTEELQARRITWEDRK